MEPKAFEIYRHFKGNLYQIITIAEDVETGDKLVIYQGLYAPFKTYARALTDFIQRLDPVKYPNASQEYRFERVTELEESKALVSQAPLSQKAVQQTPVAQASEPQPHVSQVSDQKTEMTSGGVDPHLLSFLDARDPEVKLDVLFQIKEFLTPEMLTSMELSQGMEPQESWTVEERYRHIKNDIITKQKYERQRL